MEKIALIDDNKYLTATLKELLRASDFEVKIFDSILDAKQRMWPFAPDLIICDICLPDGNGAFLIKSIRLDKTFDLVPIIVLTGKFDINTEQLLMLGATDVLFKPSSYAALHRCVKKALMRRNNYLFFKKIRSMCSQLIYILKPHA